MGPCLCKDQLNLWLNPESKTSEHNAATEYSETSVDYSVRPGIWGEWRHRTPCGTDVLRPELRVVHHPGGVTW